MKCINSNKGVTLIEMSIALAISMIVGLLILDVAGNLFKNIRMGRISSTRAELVANVRQKVSSLKDIQFSINQVGNEQLKACVCGGTTDCNSGVPLPVTMYDVTANNTPFALFYTTEGHPCDKALPNCIFEVKLQFFAQCLPVMPSSDPTPASNCGGAPAEFIGFTYSIGANTLVTDPNDAFTSRRVNGSVLHQVEEVNAAGSGVCP